VACRSLLDRIGGRDLDTRLLVGDTPANEGIAEAASREPLPGPRR
jgi:hypothetical protein